MMIYYKDFLKEILPTVVFDTFERKGVKYSDDIICFDIEVSSYFVDNGKVKSLNEVLSVCDPRKAEAIFDRAECGSLPYIWQFSFNETVVYGRDIFDFYDFLKAFSKYAGDTQLFIYVHNLAYEYAFLREVFRGEISDILLTEARKPLYFHVFENIEFRCSYRLTNLSLAKWGLSIGVEKKVGFLDYGELRTPLTELDEKALEYCEYDLLVMLAGLRKYRAEYRHVKTIPLTQTGEVRRPIKRLNASEKGQTAFIARCMPQTPADISYQSQTFQGGLTLSNVEMTNRVLRGLRSYDIASAYPAQIFMKKYPACAFCSAPYAEENLTDGNHHIMLVTFHNIRAKYPICTVSYSRRISATDAKCDGSGGDVINNGKLLSAKTFSVYITEVDYKAISLMYDFDFMEVHEHYVAFSDYIPKNIIEFMLQLYANKCLLKHSDPDLYMKSKQMLNSIYGMFATMPYHAEFFEVDYRPKKRTLTLDDIQKELDKYREKPYKNVTPYSWGIYVTSYQRARVVDAIAHYCKRGESHKVCYIDTDCLKGFFEEDEEYFILQNKIVKSELLSICKERDINPALVNPVDDAGAHHLLGAWENDGYYYEFKTEGAKRYSYKESAGDKIHITIAGVPKVAGTLLKSVDDLREGLEFDLYNSHKNLTTYLDGDNPRVVMPDGYKVKNACGINIRPTSYKLTFTDDYRELLRRYMEYDK